MVIDWTPELAPYLWTLVSVLVLSAAGILASIDLDAVEIYVGDRVLLLATAAVVVIVLVALVAVRYDTAASAAIPGS